MSRMKIGYGIAALVVACGLPGVSFGDASSASSMGTGSGQGMPDRSDKTIQQRSEATDLTGDKQKTIPDEYETTPVRRGPLKEVSDSQWLNKTVKNNQGEKLGTIKKVLKDERTQKIEYVMFEVEGTRHLTPLRWSEIQQQGDKLTMNAKKDELLPSVDRTDTKDLSPEIAQYMKEIEDVRDDPKPKVGDDPSRGTDRPVQSTGPMGERSAAGDLGPRGAPPGQAPQHEGEASQAR